MSEAKARQVINDHRGRVFQYMSEISKDVMRRGNIHDESKLGPEEFPYHVKEIEEFGKHMFGTPGYDAAKKRLGPAIKHHFLLNRHHPEHFVAEIDGMNLVDLMEMLCDWKSATLNHPESPGDMKRSLKLAVERYNISPQLAAILYNTINDYNLS